MSSIFLRNKRLEQKIILFFTFIFTIAICAQQKQSVVLREYSTSKNSELSITLAIDSITHHTHKSFFEILTKPQFGTIFLQDKFAIYIPATDYTGDDFFSYNIKVNTEVIATMRIKIEVLDSIPSANNQFLDSTIALDKLNEHDILFTSHHENINVNSTHSTTNFKTSFNSKKISLLKKSTSELNLLFFLGTDCPISQKYITELKNIYNQYQNKLSFYGIAPSNYKTKQIEEFKKTYSIPFKIVKDKNNKYASELGAKVTPEVFLVDKSGSIFYNGAINNWFYELGKNRRVVTEHYLNDAILAVIAGEKVKIKNTTAIGCFIQY